jgi:putative salt-induced outer membrane protein YdiY
MDAWRVRRLLLILLCVVAGLMPATRAEAGPKLDFVVFENGDGLVCEIKSLSRGRLSLSTDAFDTVKVYWSRVTRIGSGRPLQIELANGERYFATLTALGGRRAGLVRPGADRLDVDLDDIVRIQPVESSLWQQLDGTVDLGFNFAKANRETRYTVNASSVYRNPRYESRGSFSGQTTLRDDAERVQRRSATLNGNRFIGPRWSALVLGQYQANDELDLEYRTVLGGGMGRYLAQSNRTMLQVYGGIAWTREQFTDQDVADRPELVAGGTWDWFSARDKSIDLTSSVVSYYALGDQRRTRLETQSALRVEFLGDFYASLNGYTSYDTHPPAGREKVDAGVSLTFGWSY